MLWDSGSLDGALVGLTRGWASRCRRLLTEPVAVQAELTEVPRGYLERVYIDELSKEALIIYGVPSDIFASFDPVPIQRNLAEALRALSDSNRLTILGLLAQEPMYTTDLVSALGLSQPTVHYHLTQLRAAGLIRQEREKRGMRYSIRYHSAAQILRSLEALILEGSRRPGEGGKPEERTSECS